MFWTARTHFPRPNERPKPRLGPELGGSASVDRETISRVTVVLALRCADGLVMASDSQITDPGVD